MSPGMIRRGGGARRRPPTPGIDHSRQASRLNLDGGDHATPTPPAEYRRPSLPDLIRVTRYGFVNAYLVREDDGLTLVDTTMPRSAKPILAAAAAAGAPIVRIALTH